MHNATIAVLGLGYVGLPLIIEFGKKVRTIGFDISKEKVESCQIGKDPSFELSDEEMKAGIYASYTDNPAALADADIIIVAVPTPVDESNTPDFRPLIGASESVGKNIKKGAIVVYESTVYPGATEEICIPILEKESGLKWKQDFFVGYSPERINPGDKEHTLTKILKIVSGDTPETLEKVAALYELIVEPGVHRASSIKTAEAAKVIENTQRDLNIALMNELAIIFDKLDIDTTEVLEAAETKWNFLKFKPGLVGGHCIGVDPYYLTHKAEVVGYHPQVILAGRRINDSMGKYIAEITVKKMIAAGSTIKGARVNVLGLTFKEDCADLRNSKVIDIIHELQSYGIEVSVTDPYADPDEAMEEYGVKLFSWEELPLSDAIVAAVSHRSYRLLNLETIASKLRHGGAFVDVKAAFDANMLGAAGYMVWRL
ncbi:nucleotide sugar dehydrogenase [Stutzerimonas stutzeri]|uniref:Nucleotide sugar dehydrogenase n=1 Tax=Stutzerimonas stutzeri TaxID=316 RepID=A0A2N8RFV9_STUST|nr:nucleotide sugar dehydrogenase [Stutzerimonas stutzeri]MCQ4253825.1 nucleotide sugar dehydrogenase [Stutzerimonas stutzeri]PNF59970.1 nucleotide sugar dehydrogenase [Stutzerimonas stutzeri]